VVGREREGGWERVGKGKGRKLGGGNGPQKLLMGGDKCGGERR
jgi:hypothetical protein